MSEREQPPRPEVSICLRGVGKSYRVYARPADRLKQMLYGGRRKFFYEVRALEGVDLDVLRGETLGIVGRNGSGKSTLLRIVSGIASATEGSVVVRGRVAPLLALGAGFNPDFTGRENVFLNAALLGLSQDQITSRFDAIAAFADIGESIEHPVGTYSSGMFARLAFAVASCVDPEILVVDEILSVGDEAFARKCFARIEAIKRAGATVLFVSHNANLVLELCDRALLLEGGRVAAFGSPRQVIRQYHALLYTGKAATNLYGAGGTTSSSPELLEGHGRESNEPHENADDGSFDPSLTAHDPAEYPPEGARIECLRLTGHGGRELNRLRLGREYQMEMTVRFERDAEAVLFGFHFRNAAGVNLAGLAFPPLATNLSAHAGETITIFFPLRMTLLPGTYFLNAAVRSTLSTDFFHRLIDIKVIAVDPETRSIHTGYSAIDTSPPVVTRSVPA